MKIFLGMKRPNISDFNDEHSLWTLSLNRLCVTIVVAATIVTSGWDQDDFSSRQSNEPHTVMTLSQRCRCIRQKTIPPADPEEYHPCSKTSQIGNKREPSSCIIDADHEWHCQIEKLNKLEQLFHETVNCHEHKPWEVSYSHLSLSQSIYHEFLRLGFFLISVCAGKYA